MVHIYSFREIEKETLNRFNKENSKGHVFQTSYWGDLKQGWEAKFLGGYDSRGEILLTSLLLLRKLPYINKYMGYMPRGFTCDFSNLSLIESFTEYLKGFSRANNVAFITLDPDIHLNENHSPLEFGHSIHRKLSELGYKSNRTKNFENIQPNFVFRLNFDMSMDLAGRCDAVFRNFSTKTRYNIKVAEDRGLSLEIYDKNSITEDILDKFHSLMVITGQRDNFITRPRQYFKDMIEKLHPHCRVYMVKYNYELDYRKAVEKLDDLERNMDTLLSRKEDAEKLLSKGTPEKEKKLVKRLEGIINNMEETRTRQHTLRERVNYISQFKDKGDIYISGAVYLHYSGKGWYLYGASHNLLRDTMPNFLMQWGMIRDSLELGCHMYDFRGVSGDLSEDNPLYGLYRFKKGFSGDFVEFIGEYDLVVNSLIHQIFRALVPRFKGVRRRIISLKGRT